jgi:hypothetical protein
LAEAIEPLLKLFGDLQVVATRGGIAVVLFIRAFDGVEDAFLCELLDVSLFGRHFAWRYLADICVELNACGLGDLLPGAEIEWTRGAIAKIVDPQI